MGKKLKTFTFIQNEWWSRQIDIRATSLKKAKKILSKYVDSGYDIKDSECLEDFETFEGYIIFAHDPEYVEDIYDSYAWVDETGNILEEHNPDPSERQFNNKLCLQSFMAGAQCLLPIGHSGPHANGE